MDEYPAYPAPVYPTDVDESEIVRIVMISGEMKGADLSFWQAAQITRELDACASTASVAVGRGRLRERGIERFPIRIGDGVQVLIGMGSVSTPVLVGWIEKINRTRSAEEHGVNVQIRSVTGDLVDCSALNSPGQWTRAKLSRILTDLVTTPFAVPIRVPAEFDRIVPNFELEQGEKVFEAVERLAHSAGLIVHDTAAGVLIATRPGLVRAAASLVHLDGPDGAPDPRNNVLESDGEEDGSKRFSLYVAKGQSEGTGEKWASIAGEDEGGSAARRVGASGKARDDGVRRYRPKIINPPGEASAADCRRLAQWECARRAGKGSRLVHGVRGWRQTKGGSLWDIGLIAPVQDDNAGLYRDLLITSVSLAINERGRRAVVTLEPPEAWEPQPVIPQKGGGEESGKWASVAKATKSGYRG
ncbi:phage baseplate assembly protein [Magnetospirillum fulvum]|uniref:Bacteriophage Mu P n=1 Tax=Magnetospirillum fulvum MGU-K5 TaxID=1316936 RepID=S9TS44_MAGFU|nr:bacteriophage Mu P [Magnetospirillum fulvum]EPY01375.1 bacteriophage Mu P [Magnetospirillum fulvum MGU-K5]